MSVRENLGFALRVRRANRNHISEVVDLLAMQLGITKLMDRKPEHLSGGERQRVALGRALAGQPGALVLDEPSSALDDETREELVQLLKEVQKRLEITVLHITHNRSEAAQLADKLFRLEDGRLSETPLKL
jgi:ABC-type sugar transport system ATPase subunit